MSKNSPSQKTPAQGGTRAVSLAAKLNRSGLTPKQQAFVQAYLQGPTAGEVGASYQRAYTRSAISTARAGGSKLLKNLTISKIIMGYNADRALQLEHRELTAAERWRAEVEKIAYADKRKAVDRLTGAMVPLHEMDEGLAAMSDITLRATQRTGPPLDGAEGDPEGSASREQQVTVEMRASTKLAGLRLLGDHLGLLDRSEGDAEPITLHLSFDGRPLPPAPEDGDEPDEDQILFTPTTSEDFGGDLPGSFVPLIEADTESDQ